MQPPEGTRWLEIALDAAVGAGVAGVAEALGMEDLGTEVLTLTLTLTLTLALALTLTLTLTLTLALALTLTSARRCIIYAYRSKRGGASARKSSATRGTHPSASP